MAWIEVHQELARHPKVRRLSHELGQHRAAAIGTLLMLWLWALDYAPDGHITDAEDIREACHWHDGHELAQALEKTGWLDPTDRGWQIHDWHDYAGRFTAQREQRRLDGVRGAHERWHTDEPSPTCPLCPPHSPPISPPNGPPIARANSTNRTEPDQPNRSTRTHATPVENPPPDDYEERLRQRAEQITDERIAAGETIRNRHAYTARIMRDEKIQHEVRQATPPAPLPPRLADTLPTLDEPPY